MEVFKWRTHKIVYETSDTVSFFFDTGGDLFPFSPGQYLNIKCLINGEQISRSYSFSSSPSAKFPSITVKRVPGGKMSNYLVDNAQDIDTWEIEAPVGNFILDTQVALQSEIVFLAGGSGISPLFSMLKSIPVKESVPLLLYSNKSPDETIFFSELEELQLDNRINVHYSFTSSALPAFEGRHIFERFSPAQVRSVIERYIKSWDTAHYFICGPSGLIELYLETLDAMGVNKALIHLEYFDPIQVIPDETKGDTREVLVNYFQSHLVDDGEPQIYECTTLIEVKPGQPLLEALQENHIKVPASCLKGTCGACRATKTKGGIQMLNNYALTKQQVGEGGILLCQSYPVDDFLTINVP